MQQSLFCVVNTKKSEFVGALRRMVLAKGEQPFGATRTPRLYGVGERTFLPIWFLPLRTPFSVKLLFCRHPLKLLRNITHALYFSRAQLFAFSAIFRRRLFSSVLPHPSERGDCCWEFRFSSERLPGATQKFLSTPSYLRRTSASPLRQNRLVFLDFVLLYC